MGIRRRREQRCGVAVRDITRNGDKVLVLSTARAAGLAANLNDFVIPKAAAARRLDWRANGKRSALTCGAKISWPNINPPILLSQVLFVRRRRRGE
jgi:hypothetical protein